jgi:hypothetical protein
VRDVSPGTSSTTPHHHGRLFSFKEDSPPMAMDPDTLETIGEWDFHGQMRAKTFTAHPKIDPNTGDMIAFSYEAKGDVSPDLAVFVFDKHGKLKREWWIKAPVVSMMHDMAITDRHIILPTTGMITNQERLDEGLIHWTYDRALPCHVAIIPRDSDDKDVRWFHGTPERMLVHTTNARTEGNKVILDAPVITTISIRSFRTDDPFDGGRSPNIGAGPSTSIPKTPAGKRVLFGSLRGTRKCAWMIATTRPFRWSYMLVVDPRCPSTASGASCRYAWPIPSSASTITPAPSTASRPATRTACPSRSSCRPGRMRRRARATSSPWPTTIPRCARSWSLPTPCAWGMAPSPG